MRYAWSLTIFLAAALVLSACASNSGGSGAEGEQGFEQSEGQWILRHESPLIYAATSQDGYDDAETGGVLELVDDCLYVLGEPVVWPPSASWQADPPAVLLGGGVMVQVGDDFRSSGSSSPIAIVADLYGEQAVEWFEACPGNSDSFVVISPEVVIIDPQAGSSGQSTEQTAVGGFDLRCGRVTVPGPEPDLDGYEVFDGDVLDLFDAESREAAGLFAETFDELIFREIERTDTTLTLLGTPNIDLVRSGNAVWPQNFSASFEIVDGDWRTAGGFGNCEWTPLRDDFGVASVRLQGTWPEPDATEIRMRATERACASGQLPDGRDVIPTVTVTETAVRVLVFVESGPGGTCQRNPDFPVTILLDEPIGDRTIVDASETPARNVRPNRAAGVLQIDGGGCLDNSDEAGTDEESSESECDEAALARTFIVAGVTYQRSCTEIPVADVEEVDYARGRVDGRALVVRRIKGNDSSLAVTVRQRPPWPDCDGTLEPRTRWARYDPA